MRPKAKSAILLLLIIGLFGLGMRIYVLLGPVHPAGDSRDRYIPLATNIAARGEFSLADGTPDVFDQPIYPLILSLFHGHWRLVVAFQLCLEVAIIAVVWKITEALGGPPLIAACLMWCLPIFPWWSSYIITELTATLFSALLLLALIHRRWAWSGVLAGLCVLTRGDMALALALVLSAALVVHRPRLRSVALGSGCLLLTILPWSVRTYRVAGTVNFVSGLSGQTEVPYMQWMDLWADNQTYVEQDWWEQPQYFPPELLPSADERRQALEATSGMVRPGVLSPPQQDVFRHLIRRRWYEHFLRSLIGTRIQRPFVCWATIVPGSRNRLPLTAAGAIILALSLIGLRRAGRLALIAGALLLGRSLLPFLSVVGSESRYLVEALPGAFALCSVAIAGLMMPGRVAPTSCVAIDSGFRPAKAS